MTSQCGAVNMDGSDDPFYRYTMPAIQTKAEGEKTVLENVEDVARAMRRNPDYLVRFFAQELGASAKSSDPKRDRQAYVSGRFSADDFMPLCFDFIDKYVMCGGCTEPATKASVIGKKKKMTVALDCFSCGHRTQLDSTDRIVRYIVNHPPEAKESFMESVAARSVFGDGGMGNPLMVEGAGRDDKEVRKEIREAKKREKKEKRLKKSLKQEVDEIGSPMAEEGSESDDKEARKEKKEGKKRDKKDKKPKKSRKAEKEASRAGRDSFSSQSTCYNF